MRPGAKTLIIGPGGGWDVARALASGSTRYHRRSRSTPIIADTIMRERFAGAQQRSLSAARSHLYVEDGRSFVRRSTDKYQVMQATLVDTWAATAAGAFALSENNLYTTDAFRDYLQHLTDDGLSAITRWGFDPPRESLRLISLAIEALRQIGENEPWRHVIVARQGSTRGLRRARYRADCAQAVQRRRISRALARSSRRAYSSRSTTPAANGAINSATCCCSPNPAEYERNYTFDITPGDRQPAVLLLHGAAARSVGIS